MLYIQVFWNKDPESSDDGLDFDASGVCYSIKVESADISLSYCKDRQNYDIDIPKSAGITNDVLCGNADGNPDNDDLVGVTLLEPAE